MRSLVEGFQQGGIGMYMILLLAMTSTGVGLHGVVITLARRSRGKAAVFTLVNAGLALMTAILGAVFYLWKMTQVQASLAGIGPSQRDMFYAVGTTEAMLPLQFGLAAAVIPILCAVATGARWITLPKLPPPPDPRRQANADAEEVAKRRKEAWARQYRREGRAPLTGGAMDDSGRPTFVDIIKMVKAGRAPQLGSEARAPQAGSATSVSGKSHWVGISAKTKGQALKHYRVLRVAAAHEAHDVLVTYSRSPNAPEPHHIVFWFEDREDARSFYRGASESKSDETALLTSLSDPIMAQLVANTIPKEQDFCVLDGPGVIQLSEEALNSALAALKRN